MVGDAGECFYWRADARLSERSRGGDRTVAGDLPIVGGQPITVLLPGGAGNCAAHDDRDIANGVSGWWFYFNFPGDAVLWTGDAARSEAGMTPAPGKTIRSSAGLPIPLSRRL